MDNERLRLRYGDVPSPGVGRTTGNRSPVNSMGNGINLPSEPGSPLSAPPGLVMANSYQQGRTGGSIYQFPPNTSTSGYQAYYPCQNLYAPGTVSYSNPNNFHDGYNTMRFPYYGNYSHSMAQQVGTRSPSSFTGNDENEFSQTFHYLSKQGSSPSPQSGNASSNLAFLQSSHRRQNSMEDHVTNGEGVIKPIIDNIVGSMAMSNGTYTHFGPICAVPMAASLESILHEAGTTPVGQEVKLRASPLHAASDATALNSLGSHVGSHSLSDNTGISSGYYPVYAQGVMESSGKESPVSVSSSNGIVGPRCVTPKECEQNRPQTPGKPSYLEVLTKNGPKSGSTSTPVFRKMSTSSSSSSPIPTSGDSITTHRKSGDSTHTNSTSSNSSSCASASSSPVTKPKLISSNSVGSFSIVCKGKENVSGVSASNSKTSTSKNTPVHTPTHTGLQKSKSVGGGEQRKILTTQNNVASGKKSSSKRSHTSSSNHFDFDIEDLDEKEDWGWKTAVGRTRHNNNNSISSNSCSGKKLGDGVFAAIANSNIGLSNGFHMSDQTTIISNSHVSSERKSANVVQSNSISGGSSSNVASRKTREKEKFRSRKDERNCIIRKMELLSKVWLGHLISALTWLWSLVVDVATLSVSLGLTLLQDLYAWWQTKAVPVFHLKYYSFKDRLVQFWRKIPWRSFGRRNQKSGDSNAKDNQNAETNEELLSLMGPDRNIMLPANGDEALRRLLGCKGQDPYSILGVKSDSSDETIRRYYKRQAVLVHPDKNVVPGAEEAFKILARAFELVGDPLKRVDYHNKLMEAHAKEKVFGEIGNLLEQLRKKMEAASSSIRCTKCNSRHKKNRTNRPLFAARYCSQCRIHHAAREGDLWAERKGLFGWSWHYFACMENHVWEINEWAKCQKKNLIHLKVDSHSVMYRLVAGGNNGTGNSQQQNPGTTDEQHGTDLGAEDWDNLINNFCKSSTGSRSGMKNGPCGNMNGNASNLASNRKRKGKRK